MVATTTEESTQADRVVHEPLAAALVTRPVRERDRVVAMDALRGWGAEDDLLQLRRRPLQFWWPAWLRCGSSALLVDQPLLIFVSGPIWSLGPLLEQPLERHINGVCPQASLMVGYLVGLC